MEERLDLLELEVTQPGGTFTRTELTLQAIQNKKVGAAVEAGPYTFKGANETEAWAKSIGESDLTQYMMDTRQ